MYMVDVYWYVLTAAIYTKHTKKYMNIQVKTKKLVYDKQFVKPVIVVLSG